jgi:hypothetical protein
MLITAIMIGLLVAGIKIAREQRTYGSSLEQYIEDHNPKHSGDVERLTVEYNMKARRGQL